MTMFVQTVRRNRTARTGTGGLVVRLEQWCAIAYDTADTTVSVAAPQNNIVRRWKAHPKARVLNHQNAFPEGSAERLAFPLSLRIILEPPATGPSARTEDSRLAAANICQLINTFADSGGVQVILTGDSAIGHPDLAAILAQANKRGLLTVLESEAVGTAVPVADIAAAAPSEVRIIVLGDRKEHDRRRVAGSFDNTMTLVNDLAAAGVSVRLTLTLDADNMDCWRDIAVAAEAIGCELALMLGRGMVANAPHKAITADEWEKLVTAFAALRPVLPRIGSPVLPYDFLLNSPCHDWPLKHLPFGCGQVEMLVSPSGDCYSCIDLAGLPGFLMGNCLKDSLTDIWRSGRRCPDVFPDVPRDCRDCTYRRTPCAGGCAVERKGKVVRQLARDPACFR